jgi:hypothetical protein
LTLVSFVIWISQNIFPEINNLIKIIISFLDRYSGDQWPRSMIIYTYWDDLLLEKYPFSRNAGFLHEPGGFAAFTSLALTVNVLRGIPLLSKRNLLYFFSILSTMSTAGYIALSILFLLLLNQRKQRWLSFAVLPLLVSLSVYSYNNLDFMKSKIESHLEEETTRDLNDVTTGRIYGARKSLIVLLKYPLFGRGLNSISQPDNDSPEFADYGWISYISRFGLIFGILFMFYFIKGIFSLVKTSGYLYYDFIIIASVILFSISAQSFISTPFFLSFFFIGIYKIRKVAFNDYFPVNDKSEIS